MNSLKRIFAFALGLAFALPLLGAQKTTATTDSNTGAKETPVVEYQVDPMLVALGTLSAANVYYSYLAVGTAADCFASGVYDAQLVSTIAREVSTLNRNASLRLNELLSANKMSPDDKQAVQFLIETLTLLDEQAKALLVFIADENDEGLAYQDYRTQVWTRIQAISGR